MMGAYFLLLKLCHSLSWYR